MTLKYLIRRINIPGPVIDFAFFPDGAPLSAERFCNHDVEE